MDDDHHASVYENNNEMKFVTQNTHTIISSVIDKLTDSLNAAPISPSSSSQASTDSLHKRPATDGAPTPPAKRRRKPEGMCFIQMNFQHPQIVFSSKRRETRRNRTSNVDRR
jgi:hypothetical protein